MKLYHFTTLAALVGDSGMDVVKRRVGESVDLISIAAPGSIPATGLLPRKTEDPFDGALRRPLPPCVWLTADPDMSLDYCNSWGDFRLSVLIPSQDYRLSLWPTYLRKYKAKDSLDHAFAEPQHLAPQRRFYVYFGVIRRIVAVERAPQFQADRQCQDEPGPA